MSNKNQPHHKFVQTFVLAEQPNGYFVLNDIFRYLNEDEDEIIEEEPAQADVPAEEPPTPVDETTAVPDTYETVATEDAAEKVDEELEEVKEEEAATAPETSDAAEPAVEAEEEPETPAVEEPAKEVTEEAAPSEAATQEESVEPSVAQPSPPKAVTPVPEAPPAKKTWASMVGGKAPTLPAVPSQTPAATQNQTQTQPKAPRPVQQSQSSKPTPTEPSASPSTSQGNGWQMAGDSKKGKAGPQAKTAEPQVLAYIKNVNEKVDARTLREVLENHGELKYFDVSRGRVSLLPTSCSSPFTNSEQNCAFVEFATPEGYAAAVAANPHTVGTETISVEERRPRPGAYGAGNQAQFARGNGMVVRGGRGAMQQRSGSQSGGFPKDLGRGGGFQQQRGPKSGNVTPKGRGQPQAA